MSLFGTRRKDRKRAKAVLGSIVDSPNNVIIVHYSCESFYDRPDGASARITSIAVRNFGSGQTTSFSIHQMAERDGVPHDQIVAKYDDLEKKMLREFYNYVKAHLNHTWLHWNMRDINYGFPALAHRSRVLGVRPEEIHESCLVDLSRLLIALFGVAYIAHPRLKNLVEKNSISQRDFLTGEEEAKAFTDGHYVKLHQSTLRKADVFANIVHRLANGELRNDAKWKEIYGGNLGLLVEWSQEHWLSAAIMIGGSIASIAGIIWLIVSQLSKAA